MPIIYLLVYLALIGVVAWLLVTYIPMPPPIKTVIVVAAVVCCILLVLDATGILNTVGPNVPRLR